MDNLLDPLDQVMFEFGRATGSASRSSASGYTTAGSNRNKSRPLNSPRYSYANITKVSQVGADFTESPEAIVIDRDVDISHAW
jgi:hypothetical protein